MSVSRLQALKNTSGRLVRQRKVLVPLVSNERITPGLTVEHRLTVVPRDLDSETGEGLGLVNLQDLCFRRNGVADENGGGEFPVLAQKNRPRTGHVHGDKCVKKSRR
jgi:hypothetical protein